MTDLPTRRPRRPISAPRVQAMPIPAEIQASANKQQPTQALEQLLGQLRDVARTKQYALLGRLSIVNIQRPDRVKTIDFRKDGPVLGKIPGTDQLIVTSPWQGLPEKWDSTDEFCPDCLAPCDVCDATGKKACEGYKCGGSGKVPGPTEACPRKGCLKFTGKVNLQCALCKGSGNYVPFHDCPMCQASGKMICSSCRGTKRRPTGIRGGSLNWRDPACETCGGSKFNHKNIPQRIDDFVNARVGSMIALGPIVRFVVESVGGSGDPPQVYDVVADANGQHLVLLLEEDRTGAGAYLIGGVLNLQTRR